MNSRLKSMLFLVGTVVVGGVGFSLYTPQPATRSMAELRDAGIADGQRLVLECPERLEPQTIRRIKRNQPTALRPKQRYARIARVAVCFLDDGGSGNCVRPADGGVLALEMGASVVVPSLRRDLTGVDLAGGTDDAGEDVEVDDALQFRLDDCRHISCSQYDDAVDAGTRPNPFANRFCGSLNRLVLVPSPAMLPDCRDDAGVWDDQAGEPGHIPAPDCRCALMGPGEPWDGTTYRWCGCNPIPREFAKGAACLPTEFGTVAGDVLQEEFR